MADGFQTEAEDTTARAVNLFVFIKTIQAEMGRNQYPLCRIPADFTTKASPFFGRPSCLFFTFLLFPVAMITNSAPRTRIVLMQQNATSPARYSLLPLPPTWAFIFRMIRGRKEKRYTKMSGQISAYSLQRSEKMIRISRKAR